MLHALIYNGYALFSDDDTTRTCADVMAVFDWISCEDDGTFSAFQCDPDERMCFCLRPDGTRASNKRFRQNRASADVCSQSKLYCTS